MLRTRKDVLALLGRTLLWLPLTLAGWYFAAPVLDDIAGRMAKPAIAAPVNAKVTGYAYKDRAVEYGLTLYAPYRMGQRPMPPLLVDVEVKASLYTFGIALFLALSLALRETRRPASLFIGCAVLVVLPTWGVAFDALKQLGSTASLQPLLAWPAWGREAIALGYQVGALLLPTVAPIALWAGLNAGTVLRPRAPPVMETGIPSPESRTPGA